MRRFSPTLPRSVARRTTPGYGVIVLGTLGVLSLAGCNADRLELNNFNAPTPTGAATDPIVALNSAAGGILNDERGQAAGFISSLGILGRESFNYTPQEGRNTSGYLISPDDPAGFAAGNFSGRFNERRDIYNFRAILANAKSLSTAQVAAANGFADTFDALAMLYYIDTRHDLGGPVDIKDVATDIAPFVSRDSVYNWITNKLNDGKANLLAGSPTFPFSLTAGFAGFNTPPNFLKFNRALAARTYAYRGSLQGNAAGAQGTAFYQQALQALSESFLDPAASLDLGVYNVYSTASGETQNTINSTSNQDYVAHPSIVADAQRRADGAADNRLSAKTRTITEKKAPGGLGISTTVGFQRYPTQTTPIPIIRNEELILLRAEARYFTGDKTGALADLNVVRTRSGGLAPLAASDIDTNDKFVTALLYERRYSLLAEGHRWIDVRRFNRLGTLPLDLPNHVRAVQQVVPQQECLSRKQTGNQALFGPGCP